MATPSCRFNPYVEMMYGEFSPWTFSDEATSFRRHWRSEIFQCSPQMPLDVEIGTGNGFHFARHARVFPNRRLVGLELKYKPLVQTVRRCLREGSENMRLVRWDANRLQELFGPEEINDVYIHHPDPWPKKRHLKNRLIQDLFLHKLFELMAPQSVVEFKTDHYGYFQWATSRFVRSPFRLQFWTEDLHNSLRAPKNFVTGFEQIFIQKRQPIFYCRLLRP